MAALLVVSVVTHADMALSEIPSDGTLHVVPQSPISIEVLSLTTDGLKMNDNDTSQYLPTGWRDDIVAVKVYQPIVDERSIEDWHRKHVIIVNERRSRPGR